MWSWAADVPTTNVRIVVSIALACIYVIVMTVGLVLGKTIDLDTSLSLGGFLLTMMGLDVVQYIQKRKTHIPGTAAPEDAPAPPDPAPMVPAMPVPPAAPAPDVPKANLTVIVRDD